MPAPRTISYPAYLRLSALIRQARQYHRDLKRLEAAARAILGDPRPDWPAGWFAASAAAEVSVGAGPLLRRLGILVEAPVEPPAPPPHPPAPAEPAAAPAGPAGDPV